MLQTLSINLRLTSAQSLLRSRRSTAHRDLIAFDVNSLSNQSICRKVEGGGCCHLESSSQAAFWEFLFMILPVRHGKWACEMNWDFFCTLQIIPAIWSEWMFFVWFIKQVCAKLKYFPDHWNGECWHGKFCSTWSGETYTAPFLSLSAEQQQLGKKHILYMNTHTCNLFIIPYFIDCSFQWTSPSCLDALGFFTLSTGKAGKKTNGCKA